MNHILEDIIQKKHQEIPVLKNRLSQHGDIKNTKAFKEAICQEKLSIIGEIKRKSPAKGHLGLIADPLLLLEDYLKGGISAVSVLTEQHYFSGSVEDLQSIATRLSG